MARQQGDAAYYIAMHMNPMLGANGKAKADEIVAYLTAQGIIKDGKLQSDKILNPNPDYGVHNTNPRR
jgi:hypothetical protein